MNSKRVLALGLAALLILGMVASCSAGIGDYIKDDGSFDYSKGLDDNGRFKGVKALDYVNLPDYERYKMPKNLLSATEEEIQRQYDSIKANYTTREEDPDTERRIVDGDEVNIDYVGTIDGEEFEGGSTSGNGTDVIIGTTGYVDGFLEQLIGHKPGEEFDINVTFPEDYGNEELNGKDAVFHITINHYYKEVEPEINDDFVSEMSDGFYKTVDDLMKRIEESVVDSKTKNYLWNLLISESEMIDYPEEMMTYEEGFQLRSIRQAASNYSMEERDYLSMGGYESEEDFLESSQEDIKASVKMYCVVQAICEKEDIQIDRDALADYFEKYYGNRDYSRYQENFGENYLKMVAAQEIMLDTLIEKMPAGPRQEEEQSGREAESDSRESGRNSTAESESRSSARE